MPRYARVENSTVREVFPNLPTLSDELMEQLIRIPTGLQVTERWTYTNGAFNPPPEVQPAFEDLIREAFAALPIPLQVKYVSLIASAAFALERGNVPLVLALMDAAQAGIILPDEQGVQNIIDTAREVLGGTP